MHYSGDESRQADILLGAMEKVQSFFSGRICARVTPDLPIYGRKSACDEASATNARNLNSRSGHLASGNAFDMGLACVVPRAFRDANVLAAYLCLEADDVLALVY